MAKGQHRDPQREAYWRDVLERQCRSGLSVRGFCSREGVPESALYAWRCAIRQRDQERQQARPRRASPATAFVPVVIRPEAHPPSTECLRIELRGGRVLRLPASMPAEQLAKVIHAIEDGA